MMCTRRLAILLAATLTFSACHDASSDPDAGRMFDAGFDSARPELDSGILDSGTPELDSGARDGGPGDAGGCGDCAGPQVCRSGRCECPVAAETYCPTVEACVETLADPSHCGGCDNACSSATACESGVCRCSVATELYCSSVGGCVDVESNDVHCGACDAVCPSGAACGASSCACADASLSLCPDGCRDLMSDAASCGTCGTACDPSEACVEGRCECVSATYGTPRRLTTSAASPRTVALASNGANVAVVYNDVRDGAANVYFRLLDDAGEPVGAEVLLSALVPSGTRSALWPSVTWTGTEWGTVWYEYESRPRRSDLILQRLTAAGVPTGTRHVIDLLPADGTDYPSFDNMRVAFSSTLGFVVVGGGSAAHFIVLGDGRAPGRVIRLGQASVDERAIAVAPTGEVGVVWTLYGDVFFQQIESDGSRPLPPQEQIDTRTYPNWRGFDADIMHTSAGFVVAFYERSSAAADNHRLSVCRVGDCAARTTLWSSTGWSGNRYLRRIRLTQHGVIGMVGFQRGHLESMRFELAPGYAALDAPARLHTMETVSPVPWGLEWSSANRLVAAWSDDRWGASEVYDVSIDLGICP